MKFVKETRDGIGSILHVTCDLCATINRVLTVGEGAGTMVNLAELCLMSTVQLQLVCCIVK